MQIERGASRTDHLQAFICMERRCRRPAITKLFGDNAHPHIEAAKKPREAEGYRRKEETRQGEVKTNLSKEETALLGQGSRSDLPAACDRISEGTRIQTIAAEFPTQFVRYSRGFQSQYLQSQYHELTKQLCCGCVTRLASVSPELRDRFRQQLSIMIGAVTANREATSGLTDIAKTNLSFGMN